MGSIPVQVMQVYYFCTDTFLQSTISENVRQNADSVFKNSFLLVHFKKFHRYLIQINLLIYDFDCFKCKLDAGLLNGATE